MRGLARASLFACALVACGHDGGRAEDGEHEPPPPDLVTEVRALQRVITDDPALTPLEDVDDAIRQQRPVLAAQLLETGAIPAAERQVEALEGTRVTTPEARRFRRGLIDAYRRRIDALDTWKGVLAQGGEEDLALVDAMSAVRAADEAVLDIDHQMQEVRPIPEADTKAKRAPRPPTR